jgi:hypothetical protein
MSTALKLVATMRDSTGPLDSPWGNDLRTIEKRIKDGEASSIKARWESGRKLIVLRKGKKLPEGLLDEAAAALSVNRIELQRRVRLADRFPTDIELCHAVTQWPSWHAMVKDGLTVKRQEKKPPVAPEVAEFRQQTRRTATLYRKLNPADLAVKDLEALEQLRDEIDRLLSEA